MLQCDSIQKFHGNKSLPVLVVNFVDRADVGMVQGGSGLRFSLEAGESLRIVSDLVGQELQGDKAVQLYVLSFIDHAHPSTAKLLDDAVVRDGLADHGAQGCNLRRAAKGESTKNTVFGHPAKCQHPIFLTALPVGWLTRATVGEILFSATTWLR
jgi:hypothetical protein